MTADDPRPAGEACECGHPAARFRGVPSNPGGWVVSGPSGLTPTDAACIVAEHNAMPRLVAAVRAVGEVAKEAATVPSWSSVPTDAQEADWRKGYAAAMADFADRVTHVLASVLTEEGTDHD